MPPSPARDHRIDAVRGLALLTIFVNHLARVAGNGVLREWSLVSVSLVDCADVFFFVSGYVAGMVYGRDLDRRGPGALRRRTFHRAFQLYRWHLGTLAAVAATALLLGSLGVDPVARTRLALLFEQPRSAVPAALVMAFTPYAFDVLRLYVIFLVALPFWLPLLDRRPAAALAIVALAWAVPQLVPGAGVPEWPGGRTWYFHPLAWQALFFGGACVARRGLPGRPGFWRSRGVLGIAAAVLVAGVLVRKVAPVLMATHPLPIPFVADDLLYGKLPLAAKTTLGPVRLVSFAALALLAARFLPRSAAFWRRAAPDALAACGRHGLKIYCLGLLLVYVGGHLAAAAGGGDVVVILVSAVGVGAQFWTALLLDATAAPRMQSEKEGPSPQAAARALIR